MSESLLNITRPDVLLFPDDSQSDDSNDACIFLTGSNDTSSDTVSTGLDAGPSSSSSITYDYSTGENSKAGAAATSHINSRRFSENLKYFNMQNIGLTWTNLMHDEARKAAEKGQGGSRSNQSKSSVYIKCTEDMDELSHRIEQDIAKTSFRFDKPISIPGIINSSIFTHVKSATIRPSSVREINCLGIHVDVNLERAYMFNEFQDKIFFLPGALSFPLTPGLSYEFVASKVVTKGGSKSGTDDPVPLSSRIGKFETYYILKKSLRWEPVEYSGKSSKNLSVLGETVSLSTGLCLDLFSYLRDFCTRKYIMKFVGDSKHKTALNLDNYDRVLKEASDAVSMTPKMLLFQVNSAIDLLERCLNPVDEIETSDSDVGSGHKDKEAEEPVPARWTLANIIDQICSLDTDSETYKKKKRERKSAFGNRDNGKDNVGERDDIKDHKSRKCQNASMFRPFARVDPYGEIFDHTTGVGIALRKVFYHNMIAPLYPYYSKSQLLHIPLAGLTQLRKLFQVSPASLCMFPAFSDIMYDSHGVQTAVLKELTLETFREIVKTHDEIHASPVMEKAVSVYKFIVRRCMEHGHKFLETSTLSCSMGGSDPKLFKDAIEFLLDKGAVVKFPDPKFMDLKKIDSDTDKLYEAEDTKQPPSSKTQHPILRSEEYEKDPKDDSKTSLLIDEDEMDEDRDLIALAHIRFAEESIKGSLTGMFNEYRQSPPVFWDPKLELPCLRPVKWNPSLEPKDQEYGLCSEQLRALLTLKEGCEGRGSPLISVVGAGGSGKTSGLLNLVRHMKPNTFVVLTTQATNASGCRAGVYSGSRTIHSLLRTHSIICPHSPVFDRFVFESCRKIPDVLEGNTDEERKASYEKLSEVEKLEFDNPMEAKGLRFPHRHPNKKNQHGQKSLCCMLHYIDTIVIDEISLVDDELMASLLACVGKCGNLKRLIICGDFRQKPQISWGCFMDDMREGFPWSTVPFSHCHRFSGRALLSTNAKAIYEKKFEDIDFDPECYKLIQVNEADCSNRRNRSQDEIDAFENMYKRIFRACNIRALSDSIIITRSNEKRHMLSRIVQECTFGVKGHFNVGQKICMSITDEECKFVHNQLLVILKIEDVDLGVLKGKKGKSDRAAFVQAVGSVVDIVTCTEVLPQDPRETFRRIVAVPLSIYASGNLAARNDEQNQVIIPFFNQHKNLVLDASVVTGNFMQGMEIGKVVIDQLTFWEVSDTNRVMFTNATRASKEVTFISNPETLKLCITNPHKERNSVLGRELTYIAVEHATYLLKKHAQSRRILEETVTRMNNSGLSPSEDYALRRFPTPSSLYVPILNEVEDLVKLEDGRYDAEKIVEQNRARKAEELRIAAKAEKKARRKARKEKERRNRKRAREDEYEPDSDSDRRREKRDRKRKKRREGTE